MCMTCNLKSDNPAIRRKTAIDCLIYVAKVTSISIGRGDVEEEFIVIDNILRSMFNLGVSQPEIEQASIDFTVDATIGQILYEHDNGNG